MKVLVLVTAMIITAVTAAARGPLDMDQVFLGEQSDTLGLNFQSPKVDVQKVLTAPEAVRQSVPEAVVVAETYKTTLWLIGVYAWGGPSRISIVPRAWIAVGDQRVYATDFIVTQRSKMLRAAAGSSVSIPEGFGVEERYPHYKRVTIYLGFPLYAGGAQIRPADIKDVEISLH